MSLNNSLRARQGGYQLSPSGNNLSYKVVVEKKHFSAEVATFDNAKITEIKKKYKDLLELIRLQDGEIDYSLFFPLHVDFADETKICWDIQEKGWIWLVTSCLCDRPTVLLKGHFWDKMGVDDQLTKLCYHKDFKFLWSMQGFTGINQQVLCFDRLLNLIFAELRGVTHASLRIHGMWCSCWFKKTIKSIQQTSIISKNIQTIHV